MKVNFLSIAKWSIRAAIASIAIVYAVISAKAYLVDMDHVSFLQFILYLPGVLLAAALAIGIVALVCGAAWYWVLEPFTKLLARVWKWTWSSTRTVTPQVTVSTNTRRVIHRRSRRAKPRQEPITPPVEPAPQEAREMEEE